MKQYSFGVDSHDEHLPETIRRNPKSIASIIAKQMKNNGSSYLMIGAGISLLAAPVALKLAFFPLCLSSMIFRRELRRLPLFLPIFSRQAVDPNNIIPGKTGRTVGRPEGIGYMGIDRRTGQECWITSDKMRRHLMYLATTGGGKTVGLTTFTITFALVMGSGYSYIDGKAQLDLSVEHVTNAFRFGRGLDFLMVSYITGGKDHWGAISDDKGMTSNTFNPHQTASYSQVAELHKSLLDGDGDIWAKRAESFSDALTKVLVYLRDSGEINLSVESYVPYLSLEALGKLAGRPDIPDIAAGQLRGFIRTIPGMKENFYTSLLSGNPVDSSTIYDQFGFVTMQIIPLLNMLVGDYAYIFKCIQGQVSQVDVVINRRIMMVLLPALEKSQSSLANLGRISLAAQKTMMGSSLGSTFEGSVHKNIKNNSTSALTPFISINDEVGYYFVEGTAVSAAQARSLWLMMLYCGQDLPAMKRLSDIAAKETDSVWGNTVTKLFGYLLEKSTIDAAIDDGGEAYTTQVDRKDIEKNMLGQRIQVENQVSVTKVNRIEKRDIKSQIEGEMKLTLQDHVVDLSIPLISCGLADWVVMNDFISCPQYSKRERELLLEQNTFYQESFKNLIEQPVLLSTPGPQTEQIQLIANHTEVEGIPDLASAFGAVAIFKDHVFALLNQYFNDATSPAATEVQHTATAEPENESLDMDALGNHELGFNNEQTQEQTSPSATNRLSIPPANEFDSIATAAMRENDHAVKSIFDSGLLDRDELHDGYSKINQVLSPSAKPERIKQHSDQLVANIADATGYPGNRRLKKDTQLQLTLLRNLESELSK
ncbi:hypothetical protein [Shewanella colwelliana]|uniref:hypothetical protein n=1 Tax=Shewanella colwelliana TaxID=23 RepID=UPI0022AFAE94|nr:hypothetical protein [Shewanella colwelliana]MCZ4337816.1 hypothetical protein [Shewanella colwelliana]